VEKRGGTGLFPCHETQNSVVPSIFKVGGTPLFRNWLWTQFKKVWWVEQQFKFRLCPMNWTWMGLWVQCWTWIELFELYTALYSVFHMKIFFPFVGVANYDWQLSYLDILRNILIKSFFSLFPFSSFRRCKIYMIYHSIKIHLKHEYKILTKLNM